jgi:hypothetical protein
VGLSFLLCLGLGWSGRRWSAWLTCGVITLIAVAIPVWIEANDTVGDAGMGNLFLVIVVLGPAVIAAALGAGLGHLLGRKR